MSSVIMVQEQTAKEVTHKDSLAERFVIFEMQNF